MKNKNIIVAKKIVKTYITGKVETRVLKGIDVSVHQGEFFAVMGKSGAGKSTLMYQLSLLDKVTSGQIILDGQEISSLTDRRRTLIRLHKLGYIFQDYALVPDLTATENVMVPLLMMGQNRSDAKDRAHKVLGQLGLGHRLKNRPNQLSGGEQQRVSIARAIASEPKILFADEPTANLDTVSGGIVLDTLKEIHDAGQTIVMVTHEKEYTKYCDRVIFLEDGRIVDEEIKTKRFS